MAVVLPGPDYAALAAMLRAITVIPDAELAKLLALFHAQHAPRGT